MADRIFICNYNFSDNWIMGKIASDIQNVALKLGIECNRGKYEDYNGEEICYHIAYQEAEPFKQAKHNSVFYTHLNDSLQEKNLVSIKDKFDSFICMSPEDAQFMIELGFDPQKVYGRTLPVRNTYIKPISIGIFSACYPDGRKNEKWLIDFCADNPMAHLVNFVFIGPGWGRVVEELEALNCSSEWHNVSRKLPYEYQFQQNKLATLDYYIYMGMDGGAMGTYDAYAQDVQLCVTFDGFHKSIPDLDYAFDNKETFNQQLSIIVEKHARRLDFFNNNTAEKYVDWLLGVWNGKSPEELNEDDKRCISYKTVVEKKRKQYYGLNLTRIARVLDKKLKRFTYKRIK